MNRIGWEGNDMVKRVSGGKREKVVGTCLCQKS